MVDTLRRLKPDVALPFELGGISCIALGAARNLRRTAGDPIAGSPRATVAAHNAARERDSFRWMVERLRNR